MVLQVRANRETLVVARVRVRGPGGTRWLRDKLRVPASVNTIVVIIDVGNLNNRSTEVVLRLQNITEMIKDRALLVRTARLVMRLGPYKNQDVVEHINLNK